MGTRFVVGRHRWDMDHLFINGYPIYDMDSESLLKKNMNLHFPFSISIGNHFMVHEENIVDPISLIMDSQKVLR